MSDSPVDALRIRFVASTAAARATFAAVDRALRTFGRSTGQATTQYRAELLVAFALLAGWASLTVGIRLLLPDRAVPAVWPLSIALLLFSACGWGFLGRLATVGLYAATRETKDRS